MTETDVNNNAQLKSSIISKKSTHSPPKGREIYPPMVPKPKPKPKLVSFAPDTLDVPYDADRYKRFKERQKDTFD